MKVLAFGIHPDDIELGCGGTIHVSATGGCEVVMVDLSDGSASSNGTPEERSKEASKAAAVLGAAERINLGLPDTAIRSEDPDQTRSVVECIRQVRPDVALIPWGNDPHPDHSAGARLIERSMYLSGIHGYRGGGDAFKIKNCLIYPGRNDFDPDFVVDISLSYKTKLDAILAHESQFVLNGDKKKTVLNTPEFLRGVEARCRQHGHAVGVEFGEAFRRYQPIALSSLNIFNT